MPLQSFYPVLMAEDLEASVRFYTEHVYEVRYLDTTPLAGSVPHAAGSAR